MRGEIVGMGVRSESEVIPIVIFSSEADSRLEIAARAIGAVRRSRSRMANGSYPR